MASLVLEKLPFQQEGGVGARGRTHRVRQGMREQQEGRKGGGRQ